MYNTYVVWGHCICHWDFISIKTFINNIIFPQTFASALQSLQQRTWLIHWSLFVFFNHQKGRDLIIDNFLYQPL